MALGFQPLGIHCMIGACGGFLQYACDSRVIYQWFLRENVQEDSEEFLSLEDLTSPSRVKQRKARKPLSKINRFLIV